jgi:hypothetical protein
MKNKMMLLALAAVSAVMFVLPAVASAGEPQIDPASGKFPLTFTSAGGASELRAVGSEPVKCTGNKGTGKYTSATTGEIELTFTGCTAFGGQCNSSGQAAGVITTGTSVFHNVYLTDAKTTPGVLVTPPTGGVFASFSCFFGFASVSVTGNGVIGHLESPKCGAKQKTATLNFTATGASQTYKQNTLTGTVFNLKSSTNGGAAAEAAEVAEGTVTYAEEATLTCV